MKNGQILGSNTLNHGVWSPLGASSSSPNGLAWVAYGPRRSCAKTRSRGLGHRVWAFKRAQAEACGGALRGARD